MPTMPVAKGDVAFLRDVEKLLNAAILYVTAGQRDHYVDTYTPSIGHDACKPPGIRWVEPAIPANAAAPVHPNIFGMLGASNLVKAAATG